jgi:hypothetical protein
MTVLNLSDANLSDAEPIFYWSYLIPNLSDTELSRYQTYQTPNFSDTEHIWSDTYQMGKKSTEDTKKLHIIFLWQGYWSSQTELSQHILGIIAGHPRLVVGGNQQGFAKFGSASATKGWLSSQVGEGAMRLGVGLLRQRTCYEDSAVK